MARYGHLPVYKDFYAFSLATIQAIRKFPRMFKYTLGSAIQNNMYEALKNIVKINTMPEKKQTLTETITAIELLQIQLRLAKDAACFAKMDTYFYLSEKLTTVLKQLEGWKRALQKTP